jgi:hypothetical protein
MTRTHRTRRETGAGIWRYLKSDGGELITISIGVWMAITGIASMVIVGGSQTTASVLNAQDAAGAAYTMRSAADAQEELYTTGKNADSPIADQVIDRSKQIRAVADKIEGDAKWALAKDVGNVAVDAVVNAIPAAKITTKAAQGAKFLWDFKGGAELGITAKDVIADTPPDMVQLKADLNSIQKIKAPPGSSDTQLPEIPDYSLDSALEGYILGVKVKAASNQLVTVLPDRDPALLRDLATNVVLDMETDRLLAPSEMPAPAFGTNPFSVVLSDEVQLLNPSNGATVGMGAVQISDADKAALESGQKSQVIGQYYGQTGMEPVTVTRDDAGALTTEFTVLTGQPAASTDSSYKPAISEVPDWWDGSVDSCPYIYAWNGTAFAPVNDIISVSRDAAREYDDFMLFPSVAMASGTTEVRIVEVRNEESFLDVASFSAVVPEPWYDATVTPDGRVLSVAGARPPVSASAAVVGDLATTDGVGADLYDGSSFTATLPTHASSPAVLLVTVDGFEQDAEEGAVLGKRPSITVECYANGAWQKAGVIYPREERDQVAIDLSAYATGSRLEVRLSGTSCHTGKYQLIDALALSTAATDRVAVRKLTPSSATLNGADVASALAAADDARIHTVPGDTVKLTFEDVPEALLLVESRGWYRPLR